MEGVRDSVPLHADGLSTSAPPSTLKFEAGVVHPLQRRLAEQAGNDLKARRTLQAATYGSAFPMRRMMVESVLSQFHRLPGLPSSRIALETLNRRDADIDFEDYLNVPSESPEAPEGWDTIGATHDAMEKALGIAPKNPF